MGLQCKLKESQAGEKRVVVVVVVERSLPIKINCRSRAPPVVHLWPWAFRPVVCHYYCSLPIVCKTGESPAAAAAAAALLLLLRHFNPH